MLGAIVTFVRAYNYGAVLQCYALNKVLKELGIENEVIDYEPDYIYDQYSLSWMMHIYKINGMYKDWALRVLVRTLITMKNRKFNRFIKNNINTCHKRFRTVEELNNANLNYDVYIAGSDQIWHTGSSRFDPVFYLEFASANNKLKCSYAASIGKTVIPTNLLEEYKTRLSKFDMISIREEDNRETLETLLHRPIDVCLDPTLLMRKEQWLSLCHKRHRKKYILLYYVQRASLSKEFAQKLAFEKNLEVHCVSSNMDPLVISGLEDKKYGFKYHSTCSPIDFLDLVYNAEYVITNSFHATVFSLIFHKQFIVQTEFEDGGINNRVENLLNMVKTRNRCLTREQNPEIDRTIDWKIVDSLLETKRKSSIEYILSIKSKLMDFNGRE